MSQMELDFGIAALADYDEDGHAQVQTDSPGLDGQEGTHPAETLLPLGFYARTLDPEREGGNVGLGAPVLILTSGDRRYAIPLNDPRDVKLLPKLRKGGAMFAGGAGEHRSYAVFDGLDPNGGQTPGSFTLGVSYDKAGVKKTLGFSMNVRTPGEEEISIVHGDGHRVTFSSDGSIAITSANGKNYAQIGNDGNVLAGPSKVQGGLTVGEQLAALPVAIGPPTASALTLLASAIASLIAIAGSTGGQPALAAAWAPVTAALAALAPILAKLNAMHLKAT